MADFEFVAHPNLRALEIADAEIRTEYRIVCLRERTTSPKIAAFMRVAETLRQPHQGGRAKRPDEPVPTRRKGAADGVRRRS